MSGETDLSRLLVSMSPELVDGEFVFHTSPSASYGDFKDLCPKAAIMEAEGLTLVIPREKAEARGLVFDSTFRCITLKVHSSLQAVGLTAAFSKQLTDHGISANVIAGFYHDHIFVQSATAELAMSALKELAQSSRT